MINPRPIEDEIQTSYLEYAMSVIVSRAIPDVRDGLKPVQRRILHAMNELSFTHSNPYRKSARIVGETMGKYHPHGDMSIYDALARMAQEFSMRYPLIDGQGNFGSIDGDSPAAMRYTEARLNELAEEMIADIGSETVPFRLNFDGSLQEPEYFPSKVPNIIINGTSGIAVGMATNMPPHNLREVGEAIIHLVENPNATTRDLLRFIKGPDFPTGGVAYAGSGLMEAYESGRGKVRTRGEISLDEDRRIIIRSIPYEVNKAKLVEGIADLVKDDIISGISDIRDESDRNGIRIVIKVKDNSSRELIVNQLYERTPLERSVSIINLVLVDNVPRVMGLRDLLSLFIEHRLDIILKRSKYELKKNREREHILSGIEIAISSIDRIITIIRGSKSAGEARDALKGAFGFTDMQADAILDMRLQRLTSLEIERLKDELSQVRKRIAELTEIVENENSRRRIIVEETTALMKKYGDARRTQIIQGDIEERNMEDLIPVEDSIVVLTAGGFLKRVSLEEYRQQRRGGKGIMASQKEDFIVNAVFCSSHDVLYLFTSFGRAFRIRSFEIERRGRTSGGIHAASLLSLQEGETVKFLMRGSSKSDSLIIVTKKGKVKKISFRSVEKVRSNGIRVITLMEGDEVISVLAAEKGSKLFVVSSGARISVTMVSEIRQSGRNSMGVRAIRLRENETVISAFIATDDEYVLSVSENGLGKRTRVSEFPVHHRGSSGVLAYRVTDKSGKLVNVVPVADGDEILVVSRRNTIRVRADEISVISRATAGVKIMNLNDDSIVTVSRIEKGEISDSVSGE